MQRHGSWFFEGYEAETRTLPNGKEKRVLVYRGAWYGLGLEKKQYRLCKLAFLGLCLVLTGTYLLISFFPTAGGMTPPVGVPCLLALVPLMFMWIGLVNLLLSKEKWETRVHYAGYRRLRLWTYIFLPLMAVTAAAEIIFILRADAAGAEIPYLLGTLVCLLCGVGILLLQHRFPVTVVGNPDVR